MTHETIFDIGLQLYRDNDRTGNTRFADFVESKRETWLTVLKGNQCVLLGEPVTTPLQFATFLAAWRIGL